MPKDLFAAFRATFEEAAEANLLLEVVDASDVEHTEHELTTEKLLDELGIGQIPRLRVYNKVDRVPREERDALERLNGATAISAIHKQSTKSLLRRISESLGRERDVSEASVEHELVF